MGKSQKPEHLEGTWERQRDETCEKIRVWVSAVRELGLPETTKSLEEVGLKTPSILYKIHVKKELTELKWGKQKRLIIPGAGEVITRKDYVKVQEDRDKCEKKNRLLKRDKDEEKRKRKKAEGEVDELKDELKKVRGHLATIQLLDG